MADEENVNAGSETSGAEAADASQEDAAAETADASAEQSEEGAADAGGAADETEANDTPDTEESRTGFAEKGLHAGDQCKCPDGRTGTVHSFDAGLICIPNDNQG